MEYNTIKESDLLNYNDTENTMQIITLIPIILIIIIITNLVCNIYQTIILRRILKEKKAQTQLLENIDTDIIVK